jgi:signal transduction histidine kinase
VRGDRVRLRQVLANLIENAVKWSDAGEEVDVDVSATNGRVFIDVRDRGPGIPREEHGVIFEKFGRAKSGAGRSGTGLGLFIARSIAEAHGGSVEVRSVAGRGATFSLALPAQ